MRYEDEKKEIRVDKIHTWDLLEEVDRLLDHVPNWEPFKWDAVIQQKYCDRYKNKTGFNGLPKKKKR